MLTIEQLRKKIEYTDVCIIKKLAEREALTKQIGQLKIKEGTEIIDLSREKELFELYGCWCKKYKLQQAFVKRLFKTIINHSRKVQE